MTRRITTPSRLETLRREAGLSQERVAERLGIARSLVSMMETGERPLDRHAAGLAELYAVPRAELEAAAMEERR